MEVRTIRQIRLAKELSQETVAKACDVHVNTYIAWEKRPEIIPIGKAITLCRFLNVNIESISFCSESLQNVE